MKIKFRFKPLNEDDHFCLVNEQDLVNEYRGLLIQFIYMTNSEINFSSSYFFTETWQSFIYFRANLLDSFKTLFSEISLEGLPEVISTFPNKSERLYYYSFSINNYAISESYINDRQLSLFEIVKEKN